MNVNILWTWIQYTKLFVCHGLFVLEMPLLELLYLWQTELPLKLWQGINHCIKA